MKLKIKPSKFQKTVAVAAVFLTASPAFAFFGGIVYDPTVAADVIKDVQQAIKAVGLAKSTLSTIQANVKSFSFKKLWQTVQSAFPADHVQDKYGETAGWDTALNTNSPTAADTAWQMANLQVDPGSTFNWETPGDSPTLSTLAMIEAFDSSSPNCMKAVGQYRSARAANATAESDLENDQLDTSAATNSEVEQLNLLNAAEAQKMHEMQSQGVIEACLAEQQMVSNMGLRNAAANSLKKAITAQQEIVSNNGAPEGESGTWTSYIP